MSIVASLRDSAPLWKNICRRPWTLYHLRQRLLGYSPSIRKWRILVSWGLRFATHSKTISKSVNLAEYNRPTRDMQMRGVYSRHTPYSQITVRFDRRATSAEYVSLVVRKCQWRSIPKRCDQTIVKIRSQTIASWDHVHCRLMVNDKFV